MDPVVLRRPDDTNMELAESFAEYGRPPLIFQELRAKVLRLQYAR